MIVAPHGELPHREQQGCQFKPLHLQLQGIEKAPLLLTKGAHQDPTPSEVAPAIYTRGSLAGNRQNLPPSSSCFHVSLLEDLIWVKSRSNYLESSIWPAWLIKVKHRTYILSGSINWNIFFIFNSSFLFLLGFPFLWYQVAWTYHSFRLKKEYEYRALWECLRHIEFNFVSNLLLILIAMKFQMSKKRSNKWSFEDLSFWILKNAIAASKRYKVRSLR